MDNSSVVVLLAIRRLNWGFGICFGLQGAYLKVGVPDWLLFGDGFIFGLVMVSAGNA
jgi:hypothetical protein